MSLARSYDTATAPRGILRHLLPLFGYPGLIWRNRFMVYNFYRRELLSRFHGSFLGAWWMLAQPLFLFVVYYFVFGVLYHRGGGAAPAEYAIYLFSGVIVFHALIEATGKCLNAVTSNSSLVKKVAFPSETLVVPHAMISIVLWAVGAVVAFVVGVAAGVLQPSWMLLMLPLVLLAQFTFTVGFGLLLANANVFIPDVSNLWRVMSMAWFFMTPIFWTPDLLTRSLATHGLSTLEPVLQYGNPVYPLVMCHRIALGGTDPLLGSFWPQLGALWIWALVMLVLGYSSFVSRKHKYADLI